MTDNCFLHITKQISVFLITIGECIIKDQHLCAFLYIKSNEICFHTPKAKYGGEFTLIVIKHLSSIFILISDGDFWN